MPQIEDAIRACSSLVPFGSDTTNHVIHTQGRAERIRREMKVEVDRGHWLGLQDAKTPVAARTTREREDGDIPRQTLKLGLPGAASSHQPEELRAGGWLPIVSERTIST